MTLTNLTTEQIDILYFRLKEKKYEKSLWASCKVYDRVSLEAHKRLKERFKWN